MRKGRKGGRDVVLFGGWLFSWGFFLWPKCMCVFWVMSYGLCVDVFLGVFWGFG